MDAVGIIFLILGIVTIIIPVIVAIVEHQEDIALFSLFSIIFFLIFAVKTWPAPGKIDVKEGKAIYIEEKNIGLNSNGDTIYNYSTYRIEWLPEWEYGRKQN